MAMTLHRSMNTLAAVVILASALPAAEAATAPLPATTRKVIYQKTADGNRFVTVEAPVPKPGPGQVLVHMRAIALNGGDIENLAAPRDRTGMIAASDGAGEVVALGPDAREFRVGQRVTSMYWRNFNEGPPTPASFKGALGSSIDGVYGDYVVVDQSALVPIPAGMSFEEAASLPTAGLTAWSAVMVEGRAGPGKTVLVQGTGGVSTFALVLAHAAGAKVIVTSSSDEKLQRARQLGADETINYKTTPEWGAKVLELTRNHGADVIVEVGGKGTMAQSARALADLGTLAIIGGVSGYGGEFPALTLLEKTARAVGISVGSRAQLKDMEAFMLKHGVKAPIDRVYPHSQLDEAIARMRAGQYVGKIVIAL
jgi:NADPH:quinone reductase-like Zn-dependent oxidoreductase